MVHVSGTRQEPEHDLGPEDFPALDWSQAEQVEANPHVGVVLHVPVGPRELEGLRAIATRSGSSTVGAVQTLIANGLMRVPSTMTPRGSAEASRPEGVVVLATDLDDDVYTDRLAEAIRHRRPVVLVQPDGHQVRLEPQAGLVGVVLRALALITLSLHRTGDRLRRIEPEATDAEHFVVPPVGFAGWTRGTEREREPA